VIYKVPFYSQFSDVKDSYWAARSCSIVNLKMILDFFDVDSPNIDDLIKNAYKEGLYGPWGWKQKNLIEFAEGFGLITHREDFNNFDRGLGKIKAHLDSGGLVIASIAKRILGNRRYHSILVIGYEEGDSLELLYYHDPELLDGAKKKSYFVDKETFEKDWRKMAMFFSKKP